MMTFTWVGLLIMLVIAGLCGSIGRAIAGGTGGGFVVSIALGFIGALLGVFLGHTLKLPEPVTLMVEGHAFPIVWSIVGSALFVALLHMFSRRRRTHSGHFA